MRTTVRIDDDLMHDLKQQAEEEGLSLTGMINRLLRVGLRAASQPRPQRRFRQKAYRMGAPLIDLTKAHEVAAQWEDEEIARKMALRK